jgi:hypothetical protein
MNATRDPETILTAWLDEGPSDLPDATRRAILTALPTTRRARSGPFAPWRFSQMLIYPRVAAAVLVTVIAVGGTMYLLGQRNPVGAPASTDTQATRTPTPSAPIEKPTPAPPDTSLWNPFTSAFYGFSVKHPGAWTEQPASGHWTYETQDDADVDIFWSPTGWPDFKGFETKIPAGMTADGFISALTVDAVVHACYPATPDLWTQTTVDGHPASIAYAGCNEHFYFAQAVVVIDKRVWIFDLDGPDRSLIVPFLSTVKIDPAAVVD